MPVIYGGLFLASSLLTAIYLYIWHKHFNVNISMIFAFVPITCLGHFLYSISEDLGGALAAQTRVYRHLYR